MQGLKDIKGLMDIQEYSMYIFIALLLLAILLIGYLIKKFWPRKKPLSKEEIAKNELISINVENSKECAYVLGRVSHELNLEEEKDFISSLQKYKYKKDVTPLSIEEKEKLRKIKEKYGV